MTIDTITTHIIKEDGKRQLPFSEHRFAAYVASATTRHPHLTLDGYLEKNIKTITSRPEYSADQITNNLILTALERVSKEEPDWTYVAAYTFLRQLYKKASKNRCYDAHRKYGDFYALLKELTSQDIYSQDLLIHYSKDEILELEAVIDPEKDKELTYIGIRMLADRYIAKDRAGGIWELPQERFMVIAMTLMQHENKKHRMTLVKESYRMLQNLFMTNATPTLGNAGKSFGQLSSCFIDTVEDSLDGIYNSNTDVARLSKAGGGIGVYMGKVRSHGSDIKGFKGVSSGVIPWMKQLNNTAVSVDQLGSRNGAIAVYLDVWHKDIYAFLDAKLNNGDERYRTHDLYTGVCLPDIFMEAVEARGDWYLFDPHEVRTIMGWSLEDSFDEYEGRGTFRDRYQECIDNTELSRERVPAIEIMKRVMKSQLETGAPFMFYRDEVNRKNPNSHAGIIYCSNLCTEITQNQTATVIVEEKMEDGYIVTKKKPGDFVVCNLASINLGRAVSAEILERLIKIQIRMLDNVIDLNKGRIEVLQAVATNDKYRAIGLGTFGWHHLLALEGIRWESDKAVEYCDALYEDIAYYAIKASMELAKEKGAYPLFEGSDWSTGRYFSKRGYVSEVEEGVYETVEGKERWYDLMEDVRKYGIRNGHLMAVAPNASTALIAGSTPSIDPIFAKEYSEEKKNYKIPVVVPDLNAKTTWIYKSAYQIDQHWSIRQNAVRQLHIDQSISFNFYVSPNIKASELLNLHMDAWKSKFKTTYYVRSRSVDIEECESCAS